MTDIGPTGYVSDSAIIAWLEAKQTQQSGQLQSMMFTSDEKTNLTQDLTTLKNDVSQGQKSASDILSEMQTLQAKYAGTDLEPEVDSLLMPMEAQIIPYVANDPTAAINQFNASVDASSLSDAAKGTVKSLVDASMQQQAKSKTPPIDPVFANKDSWNTQIEDEVDKLNNVSELDVIKINELVSDQQQTLELGSNIISTRDQTSNALIANIRG